MKLRITSLLFKIKDLFYKNDISTFYSTFVLFISGISIYWLLRLIGYYWFSIAELTFIPFLSIWASFTGMLLAFFVMLSINNEKTSSGRDFIDLISTELYRLKKDKEITILSPNINIGAYRYRGESIFDKAIRKACNSGARIKFITLAINKELFPEPQQINHSDRVNFIKNGKDNKSFQLSFIYDRYIKTIEEAEDEEMSFVQKLNPWYKGNELSVSSIAKNTIEELHWFINEPNIEIIHCDERLDNEKLVGFFTKKKFFIADYSDLQSEKGEVKVSGELITTEGIIDVYSKHILEKYKSYEVSFDPILESNPPKKDLVCK